MTSLREDIINAFYNPETWLIRNLAKLPENNPKLRNTSNETMYEMFFKESKVIIKKNRAVEKIKDYIPYSSLYPGEILHAELMFLKSPRNEKSFTTIKDEENNEDYRYLLIIIGKCSKFLWSHTIGIIRECVGTFEVL